MMLTMTWFADHLLQSTLIAVLIALLMVFVKRNGAHIRYWLWFAASIKFLIPVSALMILGSQFEWTATEGQRLADIDQWIETTIQPASSRSRGDTARGHQARARMPSSSVPPASLVMPPVESASNGSGPDPRSGFDPVTLAGIAGLVWLLGFASVLTVWLSRWITTRSLLANARPLPLAASTPIPVLESQTRIEPGIVGILKPVVLLPKGITEHLTGAQLKAVLAHEIAHWRRHDNLTASLHMLVEAVFWFHPLVWWIGSRLVDERERACDEATLRTGEEPEIYAEGLLNVCQYYVAPPLRCTSGMSGGNLRCRVEAIVTNFDAEAMNLARKALLMTFAIAVIGGPIVLGSCTPGDRIELVTTTAAQEPGNWRDSPYAQALYEQAKQEGQVRAFTLGATDLNWMIEAIPREFPGIAVTIATDLRNSTEILSRVQSDPDRAVDFALTPLIEGTVLHEDGLLAEVEWSEFGVPQDLVALDGTFAFSSNTAYTVVYDTDRVSRNAALALYVKSPVVAADPDAFREQLRQAGEGDFPIGIIPAGEPEDSERVTQVRARGALVEIADGEDAVAVTLEAIRRKREHWVDPVPTTWKALLDPQFQGVLTSNDFVFPRVIAGLGLAWGEEEATRFARELLGTQDLEWIYQAQDILDDAERPYFVAWPSPFAELWVRGGFDANYVIPEPVVMLQWGLAVMESAPHPAAARLIAGWLMTPEGQKTTEQYSARASLLPGSQNKTAREIYSRDNPEIVFDTPENVVERSRLFERAREVVGAGY